MPTLAALSAAEDACHATDYGPHRIGATRRTTARQQALASGGAAVRDASLPDRQPRRLSHRRALRQWLSRRDFYQDGEGRLHNLRLDGHHRHDGFRRPPTRGSAQGAVRKARAHALRALRLDWKRADWLRKKP